MPDFLKRLRERRRLRTRRRDREDLLLELGALVFELHRQGQRAPELLQAQAAALDVVDQEVRMLEGTLTVEVAADADAGWTQTGEWQAEGEWPETGEWQADGEQTGDWVPEGAEPPAESEQTDWDATQEWQAPEEGGEPSPEPPQGESSTAAPAEEQPQ
jgi:hypothetical protein